MVKMLLIALAPAIALMAFIYQKDRYDREPPLMLLKLFIFGILIVIPVYFIEKYLMAIGGGSAVFQAFVVAGLTEESFKLLVVYKETFFSKAYDEKLDGIVYAVFASLGFAAAENIMYVLSGGQHYIYTGITRALFSVPAHMLFAITMGYYLSLSKFSGNWFLRRFFKFEALLIPVILHGIYDYILISKVYGFLVLFIIFVIFLWRFNLKRLNKYVSESKAYHSSI